ncbi:hypothetical protein C8R46DRAFT_49385 [Mycena filopes]|nr:hypothetical protein C8R46DRAFT_49385 [Mycena filopes]
MAMSPPPTDSAARCTLPTCAQLAFELFFSGAVSFILTSALLALLGLHAPVSTIARVTGLSTLVVFAALLALGVLRRRTPAAVVLPNENPEFKLSPRRLVGDVEAGWRREGKGEY